MRTTAPIEKVLAVTPSDADDLSDYKVVRALLVTKAAEALCTVKLNDQDNNTVTLILACGIWHPIAARRIWAATTTATAVHVGW